MDKKLEQQIIEAGPNLFSNLEQERTHLQNRDAPFQPIAFGLECGDGWFDLILNLVKDIEVILERETKQDIVVCQIKEKFRTLRFYISSGTAEIYDRISVAEAESGNICELCGKVGDVKNKASGWLTCLCEECYAKNN